MVHKFIIIIFSHCEKLKNGCIQPRTIALVFITTANEKTRQTNCPSSPLIEYDFWKNKFRNTTSILGEFRFQPPNSIENSTFIDFYVSKQRILLKTPYQEQSVDLYVPFLIDVDRTIARFDLEKQVLSVELPLLLRKSPDLYKI
uniref:Uncharacterized protein n=1 Tax=Romanomermis culicivorax TaxID=13658 RepID=A0A915I1M7_ROMCU